MRYRGGSEGSREVFSIPAMLCKNLSQKKGDALITALKGKRGLFCGALVWTKVHTGHCFEVSKCESSFGSFQRGQSVPFSSHQLSSECAFTLQGKTKKRHVDGRVHGQIQKPLWCVQYVCTTGEKPPSWDYNITNRLSLDSRIKWENCRAVLVYRHFVFPY